jgi:hypothetical protein
VLAALLRGPLSGGLGKLRPAGFVAVGVRLVQLGVPPPRRWLNKYMDQLQVSVWLCVGWGGSGCASYIVVVVLVEELS